MPKIYEKIRNKSVRQFCDGQREKWALPPGLKASAVSLSGHDYTQYHNWHEPHEAGWLLCSALQGSKAVIQRRFWEEMVVEAWRQFGDDQTPPEILDLQEKLPTILTTRGGAGSSVPVMNPIPVMRAKLQQQLEEHEQGVADMRKQLAVLDSLERGAGAIFAS